MAHQFSPREKRSRGIGGGWIAAIIVGVVLAILIGLGIVYSFYNSQSEDVVAPPSNKIEKKVVACPSTKLKKLSGWGWTTGKALRVTKPADNVPRRYKDFYVDPKDRAYTDKSCKPAGTIIKVWKDKRGYIVRIPYGYDVHWDNSPAKRYVKVKGVHRYDPNWYDSK